jgi:hypothetical protein
MRFRKLQLVPLAATLAAVAFAAPAAAQTVHAKLAGYQEVPAVSTAGSGQFTAKIEESTGSIYWELSYGAVQGTVVQAHIHVGQHSVNGGISVWLCQSATNPAPAAVAAQTPICTSPSGTLSGTITAASVLGPTGAQQLPAGGFEQLVQAIRAGVTYVNVHTNLSPGGEIRGQIGGQGNAGGQH